MKPASASPPQGFDLAVIGSGFGGLTAAALAARSGIRVAVLEQHTRPGGCAGDFALEGFWFPAGATVVTGLEPGGILRQVFDVVGREPDARPLDPSLVLHAGDVTVPYHAGQAAWLEAFRAACPRAGHGYRRFWEWAHELGGIIYGIGAALPSLPIERLADLRRTLPAIRPAVVRTIPLLVQTVGQAKRRLGATGDPLADALIDALLIDATGATAARCSAVQGAIALDLYRRGCQWVDGGTGRLAMELLRAIRSCGGEVAFRRRVTGLSRTGAGWTLTCADGTVIHAGRVIANVPPVALARLLGRTESCLPDSDAWGAFVLHLGIDATGLPAPHPFHQVTAAPGRELHDGGNGLVSIFRGRGARASRWSLSVSTHTSAASWRQLDPPALAARRWELEERLLDLAARVIPDVRKRVLVRRSATPVTFERFTLRPGGYVGGLIQRRGRSVFLADGHRPARHLYLAGDHVFPGQGTVGVALSGINAYRDVAESLGVKPLL